MQQAAKKPALSLEVISRATLIAIASTLLAVASAHSGTEPNTVSVISLCAMSVLFSATSLAFCPEAAAGRSLNYATALVCGGLLIVDPFLPFISAGGITPHAPAFSASIMMILRALAVWILPPRGERTGLKEAFASSQLSLLCGTLWLGVNPDQAPIAAVVCLVLSWPYLVDGINAFADKVYLEAARAAGVRSLGTAAFAQVASARDIVIDKAAVMSGPNLVVTNVMAFNNEPKTLLAVAASAESRSDHPVAEALRQLAEQWRVDIKRPDRFEQAPGLGAVALLGGQSVVIGTANLMQKHKIDSFTADAIARSLEADGKTVLRVAVGGRVVGVLGLEGTLRQDAGVAAFALRGEGLVPWLYSGDSEKTREALANMLGLEPVADPRPGESAVEAAYRCLGDQQPLVLTLSQDRTSLELRSVHKTMEDHSTPQTVILAVSNTEDIGAFPALKDLAMRRTALAAHAQRFLSGLSILCGVCGGSMLLPMSAAPVLFLVSLTVLWAFARYSIADPKQETKAGSLIAAS